jgi:WD40 repeat protein
VVRVYQVIRDHADEPTRRRDRPLIRKLTEIKSPHDDYVRGVVCSDSGRLFSAGYDSTLCVYEIAEANSVRPVGFAATTLRGCHAGAISTVAYEWENNLLLTGSFDRLAKLWSPEGKLLQVR